MEKSFQREVVSCRVEKPLVISGDSWSVPRSMIVSIGSRRRCMLTVATLAIMMCTISSFTTLRPRMFVYKKLSLSKRPPLLSLSAFITSTSTHNDDQQHRQAAGEGIGNETTMTLDPLIVCGPSGAGKGSIIHKYMTERGGSEKFQFTASHTTRQPREGESDGVHYHFVSVATMRELLNLDLTEGSCELLKPHVANTKGENRGND
jgi:Guanylate kinase